MVMAQSLFKALCVADTQAKISVLAPAATFPLVERMPEVEEGILSPIAHGKLNLSAHFKLGKSLRGKFDQAIVLPGSIKSALIPFFAKVPVRTAWKGEMRYGLINDMRNLDEQALPLMVDQYLALSVKKGQQASAHLKPSLDVDNVNIQTLSEQFNLDKAHPVIAFCPGAEYGPAKQWPAEKFAELANKKIAEGWQVWLFGGPKDLEIAKNIEQRIDDKMFCKNLVGKTKLLDAIDLLSEADAVVSNDSGLMHVSAALDRKLVVIYGSSSPNFTPPLSDKAKTISLNLDCSPCFERECPLGHLDCLKKLSSSAVEDTLDQFKY
jgi:heptosyltransferase-2